MRSRTRIEDEEEVTSELYTLRALATAPIEIVEPATPLGELRRLLVERRVPALAVVDGRALVGIVTRTDVLGMFDKGEATARDVMSSYVVALPATALVENAAALMAYEGIGQVIVVGTENELVGMVSALDIARHFAAVLRDVSVVRHTGGW